MEEEFYSIIKLISGEEILSLVCPDDNDGDPVLVLQNPITIKMIETSHGIHIKVKSWIELSDDNFFIIRKDKIITMTETKDERLIEIYNNYVEEDYFTEEYSKGRIKPSKKMGYISSVEEARKSLENLYNLKDIKET